jgi:hypothetical protein
MLLASKSTEYPRLKGRGPIEASPLEELEKNNASIRG